MNPMLEINELDFEAEVLKAAQPVLVGFLAPWSQPCRILEPVLNEVATECNDKLKIVKVNVDDNPDLGLWYGIQSIPTLLYFINGNVNAKIVGTTSKETILSQVQSLATYEQSTTEKIRIYEHY